MTACSTAAPGRASSAPAGPMSCTPASTLTVPPNRIGLREQVEREQRQEREAEQVADASEQPGRGPGERASEVPDELARVGARAVDDRVEPRAEAALGGVRAQRLQHARGDLGHA